MRTTLAVTLLCIVPVPSIMAQTVVAQAVAAQTAVTQTTNSGFFKTSDGIRTHYLEAGSGRPIVFIPGWTMPAWIWQKQIDEFSKHYHVIAVDPRSQGESDKPAYGHLPETRARDYKELVDHLGLKLRCAHPERLSCNYGDGFERCDFMKHENGSWICIAGR
jgi:hypothetical protein